jgi:leader peptidase (prepilin peptidase)/N-methyltransferase
LEAIARALVAAVLGLTFGSFLTVVVYRVPRGESPASGRSACRECGETIRARDNVPVLSYLWLRGRCRNCRSAISAEYPVIEAITGALFVAAALAFRSVAVAALLATLMGVLVACSAIDVHHRVIPNRIVYPSLAVALVAVVALDLSGQPVSAVGGALGLLTLGGGLFLVAVVQPRGMGMGDVKLAALIGLVLGSLGWAYVGVAAMTAVLAGGLGAVAALALGGSRKDAIPFGPYLAGGAIMAALFAPSIAEWYRGLAGYAG